MNKYFIKLGLLLVLLCLVTACDRFAQADTMLEEYHLRLERVLEQTDDSSFDVDSLKETFTLPSALPSPQFRRYSIETYNIKLRELFGLSGCELQRLAGERNSSMGKNMLPVQQLDYELRFLRAADACRELHRENEAIRSMIDEVVAFKQKQLPKFVWNAVWANEEIANFLSYSGGFYPVAASEQSSLSAELKMLKKQLNALLTNNPAFDSTFDSSTSSNLQYKLQYNNSAGQLIRSMQLLTQHLEAANVMMDKRIAHSFCPNGKPTPKAQTMQQFFFSIYIGKVQPYLSNIYQQADALLPTLNRLAQIQPPPSQEFSDYRNEVLETSGQNGLFFRFKNAIEQHTLRWQQLLQQCGMSPR